MPFICDDDSKDFDACIVSLEAYGHILDDYKYCYASFEISSDDYNELSQLLNGAEGKKLKIIAKVKNGVVQDFKINLEDLAERFHDHRLKKITLLGWGLNNRSFRE